jgi:hypothetical protein
MYPSELVKIVILKYRSPLTNIKEDPHHVGLYRAGGVLSALAPLEAPRVGETHQGELTV